LRCPIHFHFQSRHTEGGGDMSGLGHELMS
jgi:hypothetical protein